MRSATDTTRCSRAASELPALARVMMKLTARVMTRTAYWL